MAIFSSDLAHSTRRRWTLYAGTLVFLGLFGSWLALDFLHERARTLDEMGRLALHKSQLLSSVFGDAFLSADYVLRDIAGRIDPTQDLNPRQGPPAPTAQAVARKTHHGIRPGRSGVV